MPDAATDAGPPPDPSAFGLGWPFDRLQALRVRWAFARRREQAAAVRGDTAARLLAELDAIEIGGELDRTEQEAAEVLLGLVRLARRCEPRALAAALDEVVRDTAEVAHLRRRVEELEEEVSTLLAERIRRGVAV